MKNFKNKVLTALVTGCIFLFTNNLNAQYYPEFGDWKKKAPAESGLNNETIDEAVEFAMANEYRGPRDLRVAILQAFGSEPYMEIVGPTKKRGGPAGLIVKDGYIVAEWGDVNRVDMTFSVTKSYLSTVVGLAWDKGLISSVEDPVINYVWDGSFNGEHNSKITWEHLLNQSSDWSGTLFGMPDWGDRPARNKDLDDWRYRELHDPGTYYKYNDVRVNLMAYSVLQVWREPLPKVLKTYIMDPIGASTTWRWFGYKSSWVNVDGFKVQSVSGGGHSGGGLFISAMDHARFGLLFERDGVWKDEQIVSKEWIDMATRPSPAKVNYGYMWWLNTGSRGLKDIPESVFNATGFGGNYIFIDQENDLVLVMRWLDPSKLVEFLKIVYEAI
jgi:CubicO group peptidase (beta-lactamase class C family)